MNKSKRNPNLCTTRESLLKGTGSLFRISGLFEGKARVCWVAHLAGDIFSATTAACSVEDEESLNFSLHAVKSGKINIMCIERGK